MFPWSAKVVLIVMTMQGQTIGFHEFKSIAACEAAKARIYDAMSKMAYDYKNPIGPGQAQWADCVEK